MSEYAIKVEGLSKIYKLYHKKNDRLKEALSPFKKKYHEDFYALNNITFTIPRGSTVGFIGQNGSGKSTLLKILTGIIPSNGGHVHVNGRISALLELGTGFNPELTGYENIFFNGTILGLKREEIEEKLDSIINFAEIGEFIDQPVKTYSSGMFVRLAFSVAINVDPDILIVDEALSVGDAYFSVKCMNKMRELKKSGVTIIFVSHDPGAVKTLCEEAYLLEKGLIIDSGSPDKVFDYYNSLLSLKGIHSDKMKNELRSRVGNKKIEIIDIDIKNSKDISSDIFVSGEEIQILIKCKANESMKNPIFGIMLRDRLGNDIFGITSKNFNNYKVDLSSGELLTVKFSMKLDLGPNVYNLTVAASKEEIHLDECYDWINNIKVLKVIPDSKYRFLGYSRLYTELEMIKNGS